MTDLAHTLVHGRGVIAGGVGGDAVITIDANELDPDGVNLLTALVTVEP